MLASFMYNGPHASECLLCYNNTQCLLRKNTTNSVQTLNFNTQLMLTAEKPFWVGCGKKNAIFFYRFCKINLNYVCLTFAICSSYFVNGMKLASTNSNFRPRYFSSLGWWRKCAASWCPHKKFINAIWTLFLVFSRLHTHTDIHKITSIEWVKVHTPTFCTMYVKLGFRRRKKKKKKNTTKSRYSSHYTLGPGVFLFIP